MEETTKTFKKGDTFEIVLAALVQVLVVKNGIKAKNLVPGWWKRKLVASCVMNAEVALKT